MERRLKEGNNMSDIKNKNLTFGEYLQIRRSELKISMRKFAERIGASAMYISFIEYGTKPAPENEMLDKIIKALQLSPEEEKRAYDLAARSRGERTIAQDTTNYIRANPIIVRALRTAKDAGAGVREWERFIEEMEKRNKTE